MAFIPLPNGMRVVAEGQVDLLPVVNVFHVTAPGTVTPTDLSAVESVFQAWYGTDMSPLLSTHWTLPTITVTDVSVANGQQVIVSGLSTVGANGGDPLPSNVAWVFSWRTPFTGRSFRGRTYFGGLAASASIDGQHLDPSYGSTGLAAANALMADLNSAGYHLVVASYFNSGAPRVTGVATIVTNAIVNLTFDTQRKRIKQ